MTNRRQGRCSGAAATNAACRALPVPQPFLVLATQNPIEQEGTYPLPEAELDRFMLKLHLAHIDALDKAVADLEREVGTAWSPFDKPPGC